MSANVDRQKTTPFLLKLFYRTGTYHRSDEFSPTGRNPQHLMIYTWPNCSLRELSLLLVGALPDVLPSPAVGTRLAFRLVYPDTREASRSGPGRYVHKDLGSIVIGPGSHDSEATNGAGAALSDLAGDADKTLQDAKFIIGDYVTCAILPPTADGKVAAPPPPSAALNRAYGSDRPPRENGFGSGYGGRRGGGGPPRDFGGGGGGVPSGPWIRGDVPGGPRGGYGRPRGRGRGGW